jgi:heterodisulfide reductase subunit C
MPVSLIQEKHQVFYCFSDCGVCEGVCPVSRRDASFSPRRIVMKSVLGGASELARGPEIWRCLSCGACSYHCPAKVDFLALIRELRALAIEAKCAAKAGAKGAPETADAKGRSPNGRSNDEAA